MGKDLARKLILNRQCSETSAYKIQTPENHPNESIQHSGHGESLKSRLLLPKYEYIQKLRNSLEEMWPNVYKKYEKGPLNIMRHFLSMFGCTYLCEYFLNHETYIKSRYQCSLKDAFLSHFLRHATKNKCRQVIYTLAKQNERRDKSVGIVTRPRSVETRNRYSLPGSGT